MDSSSKDLFSFTRGEKRGVLILSGVILLLLLILLLLPVLEKPQSADKARWRRALQSFVRTTDSTVSDREEISTGDPAFISGGSENLFSFDPNLASAEDLGKLGLKSWQIARIQKFRNKGGVFRKKEDFSRIYGITAIQYERLEPYISIDSSFFTKRAPGRGMAIPRPVRRILSFEINSADSLQLDSLFGIGPVLASRIIRYRNRLGGFVSLDQLKEVYGFPLQFYDSITAHLSVDTSRIAFIHLNTVSLEVLRKHPYLNIYQARSIIRFRELQGRFTGSGQVIENQLLPPEVWSRIKSYLRVD